MINVRKSIMIWGHSIGLFWDRSNSVVYFLNFVFGALLSFKENCVSCTIFLIFILQGKEIVDGMFFFEFECYISFQCFQIA